LQLPCLLCIHIPEQCTPLHRLVAGARVRVVGLPLARGEAEARGALQSGQVNCASHRPELVSTSRRARVAVRARADFQARDHSLPVALAPGARGCVRARGLVVGFGLQKAGPKLLLPPRGKRASMALAAARLPGTSTAGLGSGPTWSLISTGTFCMYSACRRGYTCQRMTLPLKPLGATCNGYTPESCTQLQDSALHGALGSHATLRYRATTCASSRPCCSGAARPAPPTKVGSTEWLPASTGRRAAATVAADG